jgi:DNA-binding XRE family transcriptional regulator
MDYKWQIEGSIQYQAYAIYEYAKLEYRSQGEFCIPSKSKVDLVAIGSRIKKLRGALLQEELANYLHVSQGHLSKIERGKIAPSFEILFLLSDRFRKSIDWILRGEGN